MKDSKMKLSTTYFVRYILTGAMWILHGILKAFATYSLPVLLISRLSMVFAVVFIIASLILPHEHLDEVTRSDFKAACTYTLGIMMFVMMVLSILSEFVPSNAFPFQLVYPFVIGGGLLLIGGIFVLIEKV